MSARVSVPTLRYTTALASSANQRIRAWLDRKNTRAVVWLVDPRASLAYAISDAGASLMRLSGKLHPDPISDVGEFGDEMFATGYRSGWRAGRRTSTDPCAINRNLIPNRADGVHAVLKETAGYECGGDGKCPASDVMFPNARKATP